MVLIGKNTLMYEYENKIKNTPLLTDPWDHLRLTNFLAPKTLRFFQLEHWAIDWDSIFDEESSWSSIDEPKEELEYFASKDFAQLLFDKFGVPYTDFTVRQSLKLDEERHTLQTPHQDKGEFIMTMQIFLQDKNYDDGGTILMSDGMTDSIELPLQSNSCTIFLNNENSWHRVQQRGYRRESFLQRWIQK